MVRLSAAALVAAASIASATSNSTICSTASQCTSFVIDLTWGPTDPSNAFSRYAILTNGSLPGPPLKLTVGECVDFTVINNLPNITGVHFHGIRQLGTPWADGVPGLSQKGIQPGDTYNYQWVAEDPGVYFYHAHYKGQLMDGLAGAIIIAAADNATKPFSAISSTDVAKLNAAEAAVTPVLISDWRRYTFAEYYGIERAANIDFACSDAIVLNGQGSNYCLSNATIVANEAPQVPQLLNGTSLTAKGCIPVSNQLIQGGFAQNLAAVPPDAYDVCTPYTGKNASFTVDPADGWAAFSFINSGGVALLKVTIDNHKLYVYEANGNYIIPQVVDQIEVDNADRVSFFVKLDQTPADYQIRVANAGLNQILSGYGVMSYKGSTGPAPNAVALMNVGGGNTTAITALNLATAAPWTGTAPAVSATADTSFVLDIEKAPPHTEAWAWVLNGVESYNQSRDDTLPPLLFQNPSSIPQSDLILRTNYNQWVDLIIKISGPLAEPHPIHKHANKFYVIGAGVGDFNYTTVAAAQAAGVPFNLENPPYVDGYTTPPNEGAGAWVVFRYQANTPGAWILHCHVQTHFSGGMAVAILDAVDQFPSVPSDVGQVCPNVGSSSSSAKAISSGNGTSPSPATYTGAASNVAGWSFGALTMMVTGIAFLL